MGNDDRNNCNIGFIKKDNEYRLSPLFDNGLIVNDPAIDKHLYSQGISKDKFENNYSNDVIEEFFLSKRYGYLLADELEKLNITDLYSLIDDINVKYKYEFDTDYELYVLKRLDKNLRVLNEYKKEFYDESKMLRK